MRVLGPFFDIALATVILIGVDVWLFHYRAYAPWLKTESYSGMVEAASRRFHRVLTERPGSEHVVIMGDSTTGASVQELQLESALENLGHRVSVINMAQGGSTARSWYHLVANEQVDHQTTRLLVLGIHPASFVEFETVKPDLDIVKSRVTLADAWTMASSFSDIETKSEVFFGMFFRLIWFREDVRSFILGPRDRITEARDTADRESQQGTTWRRTNRSRRDLLSARLGPEGTLIEKAMAPFLQKDRSLRAGVERNLRRLRKNRAQQLRMDPHQKAMLRRLVQLLHHRGVPVAFVITPKGPYPFANRDIDDILQTVQELQAEGLQVTLVHDIPLLEQVEEPTYFRDLLHLNAQGSEIFTRGLVDPLAEILS